MLKIFTNKKLFTIAVFSIILTVFTGITNAQITSENPVSTGNFMTGGARAAPLTVAHTVNGLNRILYVGVSNYRIPLVGGTPCGAALPPTGSVVSVTFNGVALERLTTQTTNLGAVVAPDFCSSVEIFRLTNPNTTANPLTADVEVTQPTGGDYIVVGAVSFFGVDQTTPAAGAIVPASGSSQSPNVTVTTAANDAVLGVLAIDFNAGLATPSQTLLWEGNSFFGGGFIADIGEGGTKAATGTSTTLNWMLSDSEDWALGGVRLQALGTTVAASNISGQIKTIAGRPIRGTSVTLQNLETGETLYRTSNNFGYYNFENLETGSLYQIRVSHGRYFFSPDSQIFQIYDSLTDFDFIGGQFGNTKRRNQKKTDFRLSDGNDNK